MVDHALIDSGATNNFMTTSFMQKANLPIQNLSVAQEVFNVDGTQNKDRDIHQYANINVQTGQNYMLFRFLLTDTGTSTVILGYPWLSAVQPRIDWKHG